MNDFTFDGTLRPQMCICVSTDQRDLCKGSNFSPSPLFTLRSPIILGTECCAVLSRSVTSYSLWPHGQQPARLLCSWKFSRQEYWSGLSCPPPGDLPNLGIKPRSPTLQVGSLLSEPPGSPTPGHPPCPKPANKLAEGEWSECSPNTMFEHFASPVLACPSSFQQGATQDQ